MEDLRFIIKQNLIKEISFIDNSSEEIPLEIVKPSNLSLFLYFKFFFKKNNLYEIHNKNLLIINHFLRLINNEWKVCNYKKSFLCRIKINNNRYELKLIKVLIATETFAIYFL